MHPPPFHLDHRLSEWPDCSLELRCLPCGGRSSHPAIKLLMHRLGDPSFRDLLLRLRCQACRKPPAPVYLVAGLQRTFCHGAAPDWSLELVPPPFQGD